MATIVAGSERKTHSARKTRTWLVVLLAVLGVLIVAGGVIYLGSIPRGNVLTDNLSAPLGGATTAKIDINSDRANLTVDTLAGTEQVLASGTLQYFEHQGLPTKSANTSNGQATLVLKGGGTPQMWFPVPWAACVAAYEWQVRLNPTVASDITAYSGGGNVKLNLAGMSLTRLSAETGGGNMDVVLPDNTANLNATAKTGGGNVTVEVGNGITGSHSVNAGSGAGNVTVRVPGGIAARVHASSGLGQVTVDPAFSKIDANTYQSAGYESAANKIEITVSSGAGNAVVSTK